MEIAEDNSATTPTLKTGQAPELNLADAIRQRMAPFGGVDLEPHPPVAMEEPPSFEL